MDSTKPDDLRDKQNEKKRDSADFQPLGGLYADKRDHGTPGAQHVDEGTKERDAHGNKGHERQPNAAGSQARSEASEEDAAAGHGNQ